jgi:hypothetical protein
MTKRNQDMNEKDLNESIDARLKKADPVAHVALDDALVLKATEEKASWAMGGKSSASNFSPTKNRFAFGAVAMAAVALVAAPLIGLGNNSSGALITLGANAPATTNSSGSYRATGSLGAPEDASGASDKMMMINPFTYEFSAGSELSTETGKGHVYKAELVGTPESVLAKVAKALGLQGSVTEAEYSTKEYPQFIVGSQDGKSSSAAISWSGTGNWWFNNPLAYPQPDCLKLVKAEDGSEYCESYAEQKLTPELMPSKSEAVAQALKIFRNTGLETSAAEIAFTSNEWGAYATSAMKVDGQVTSIEWSVSWGTNGEIASVSGHSVKLVDQGEFNTISAKDAVDRISDWRYSGSISGALYSKYAPAIDMPAIAYSEPVTAESSEPSTGGEDVAPSMPAPQVVKIDITKAVEAMMAIWDSAGGTWIVPGYIMIGEQNWLTPVFSLQDGVVELPALEFGIETR